MIPSRIQTAVFSCSPDGRTLATCEFVRVCDEACAFDSQSVCTRVITRFFFDFLLRPPTASIQNDVVEAMAFLYWLHVSCPPHGNRIYYISSFVHCVDYKKTLPYHDFNSARSRFGRCRRRIHHG